MERGFAKAPWGQVHFAQIGEGTPVVLYPNRPRSWVIYQRLAGLLAAKHRVVVLDSPGCGASDPIDGVIEVDDLSRATMSVMDALGLEQAHISGHHTGATVALDMAANHADRVISIAPTGLLQLTEAEKKGRLEGSMFSPVAGNPPQSNGAHLLYILKKYPPTPPEDLAFLNDWVIDNLVSEASQYELAMAIYRYDETKAFENIALPTLLVQSTGPGEPPTLQRMSQAQQAIAGSRLELIEGGDVHFIHHRAGELSELLLPFFAAAEAARSAVA